MKWLIDSCILLSLLLCISCSNDSGLTICFTGDVLLDRGIRKKIERNGIESIFRDAKPLFLSSDAVVVNLENPVTKLASPLKKKYVFRAEPEWLLALRESGITHAAMANNHTIDQGLDGLADTYENLIAANITPIGYGSSQKEACKPRIIKKNGIKAALFNSMQLNVQDWRLLEHEKGICEATAEQLQSGIKTFKAENPSSFVVVILHWGIEYQKEPTQLQREQARQLIDSGTDAIIGHHPHVIQEEEIYNGKPIFYSLGNFVFDQKDERLSSGLAVKLFFSKQGVSFCKEL